MNRVLLIAGPGKQRPATGGGLCRAVDRYDTTEYKVLRELEVRGVKLPTVIILSAKYGWIDANTVIAQYTRQMSEERVDKAYPKLVQQWAGKYINTLLDADYVHLHLPGAYRYALARMGFFVDIAPEIAHLTESYLGMYMQPFVRWLQGFEADFSDPSKHPMQREEALPSDLKTVLERAKQEEANIKT